MTVVIWLMMITIAVSVTAPSLQRCKTDNECVNLAEALYQTTVGPDFNPALEELLRLFDIFYNLTSSFKSTVAVVYNEEIVKVVHLSSVANMLLATSTLRAMTVFEKVVCLTDGCRAAVADNIAVMKGNMLFLCYDLGGQLCLDYMDTLIGNMYLDTLRTCSSFASSSKAACQEAFEAYRKQFSDMLYSRASITFHEKVDAYYLKCNATGSCGNSAADVTPMFAETAVYTCDFPDMHNRTVTTAAGIEYARQMDTVSSYAPTLRIMERSYCINAVYNAWVPHLKRVVCVPNSVCEPVTADLLRDATDLLDLSLRRIPLHTAVIGIIACCCILLVSLAIAGMGLIWHDFQWAKLPITYYVLLGGLVAYSVLRMAFWIIGMTGFLQGFNVPHTEVEFFLLDKFAGLFFVMVVLLFCYTWLKAVHLADVVSIFTSPSGNSTVVKVARVVFLTAGLVVTVVVITVSAIYGSKRTISAIFMGTFWRQDYAEMVSASFLFVVSCVLVAYVFATLRFLTAASKSGPRSEVERNLKSVRIVMGFSVALCVLCAARVTMVFLRLQEDIFYGYSIFYGVGTLIPETIGAILILIVTVTRLFYTTRKCIDRPTSEYSTECGDDNNLSEPLLIPAAYRDV